MSAVRVIQAFFPERRPPTAIQVRRFARASLPAHRASSGSSCSDRLGERRGAACVHRVEASCSSSRSGRSRFRRQRTGLHTRRRRRPNVRPHRTLPRCKRRRRCAPFGHRRAFSMVRRAVSAAAGRSKADGGLLRDRFLRRARPRRLRRFGHRRSRLHHRLRSLLRAGAVPAAHPARP